MATIGQISSKLTPNYILLITTLLFLLPLITSSSPNKTHINGLIAHLIAPMSPESPFYTEILKANNISLTTTSNPLPLNRTHYFEWLKQELSYSHPTSKNKNVINVGKEKFTKITFRKFSGYVMKFYLGTPPRPVYGGFDTGSELVWFHCKENPTSVTNMSTFDQFKSSTYRMISCKDEYMCDTHTSVGIRCRSKSCEFVTEYVDDTHVEGVMGYDLALTNPYGESLAIPDLMFGCNTNNPTRDKVGLIGGGNGKYSFPKQISLFDPKFSYCISNDVTKTYEIKFGKEATLTGNATQVLKNNNTPFYYLNVIGIKVNGKHIFVSSTEFQMSSDGSKGFIIDSGATLSYLSPKVFDGVKYELEQQLGPPQKYWIYDICYPLSRFPKMKVRFKPRITIVFSESELELPIIGTWQWEPRFELLCLLIRRTDDLTSTLGLTQLWDVNVGHDPVNNMLYLSKTDCPTHDL